MSEGNITEEFVPLLGPSEQTKGVSIGDIFGDLTITGNPLMKLCPGKQGRIYFPCRCSCGVEKPVLCGNLRSGRARSCGCSRSKRHVRPEQRTHGCEPARLFRTWSSMRSRCKDQGSPKYADYGGRGISICQEWDSSFVAFREWSMANGYTPDLLIDRVDNDGNYEPGNCRWTTSTQQNRNKRNNRFITAFGETKTVAEWITDPRCSVTRSGFLVRLRCGWSVEDAITKPNRWTKTDGLPEG